MSEAQSQGQATPSEASADTQAKPEAKPSGAIPEGYVPQKDVNKIAANEKREGKTSAINELLEKTGAESIDDVLAAYTEYQGIQEAVTSEADKANQRAEKSAAKEKEWQERYYAEKRGNAFREALRDSGINPERIKGAMRLADLTALEIDKEGNVSGLEEVVASVQEDSPEWFGQAERPRINAPQTTGTGVAGSAASPNGQTPEEQHAQWLVNLLGQ